MSRVQKVKEIFGITFSPNSKNYLILLIFHSTFFFTLLFFALMIFQGDLTRLWFAGMSCNYCNDSWRFIGNLLTPFPPPYPYVLLTTSLHHLPFYTLFSWFLPQMVAISLAILIIQFIAALFSIFLFFHFLQEIFDLSSQKCLLLSIFFECFFLSPFLLLASAEILFFFYQLLAFTFFVKRRYLFALLSASMTFAIRFNGGFFVLGFIFGLFWQWKQNREFSFKPMLQSFVVFLLMIVIGFSAFIISWVTTGDFFLPITSLFDVYSRAQGYIVDGIFSLPFVWWIDYGNWSVMSESVIQLIYFVFGVSCLILGFLSLVALVKWLRGGLNENKIMVTYLFLSSFLGLNFLISGSNFARYLSISFPFYPIFPLQLQNRTLSPLILSVLGCVCILFGLLFNLAWWSLYPQ